MKVEYSNNPIFVSKFIGNLQVKTGIHTHSNKSVKITFFKCLNFISVSCWHILIVPATKKETYKIR